MKQQDSCNYICTTEKALQSLHRWNSADVLFRAADLSRSIKQIVRLPEKFLDFASTPQLFTEICALIAAGGFPAVALPATYFVFATWFPDILPLAPCLLVTGPPLEAEFFLQLLGCLVRRPVPISEFNLHALRAFPMRLAPTLRGTHHRAGIRFGYWDAGSVSLRQDDRQLHRADSVRGFMLSKFIAKPLRPTEVLA